MNTIWSDYIQSINTLYLSRTLRFSDTYKENYMNFFNIGNKKDILEIGCGPGALTNSLSRWYPNTNIIGIDRDTSFIEFAKQKMPHLKFIEADATALPFKDNTFDVVISNTVQEHIPPEKFFNEQFRVLKPNGVCLVLSARRGIQLMADCITQENTFEKEIWQRTEHFFQNIHEKYEIGQYTISEKNLPHEMEKYGFHHISTDYLTINLTPDNPNVSRETAHEIINSWRQTSINSIHSLSHITSEMITSSDLIKMKELTQSKFDKRMELYNKGIKQWDTAVSLIMIIRGVKEPTNHTKNR